VVTIDRGHWAGNDALSIRWSTTPLSPESATVPLWRVTSALACVRETSLLASEVTRTYSTRILLSVCQRTCSYVIATNNSPKNWRNAFQNSAAPVNADNTHKLVGVITEAGCLL
jgi:hypothetical protein